MERCTFSPLALPPDLPAWPFAEPGKGWLISLLGSSTSAQPAADRPMLPALVFEAARTWERTAPRAV